MEDFTRAKQGLVLVTGPTGSGKTTTMAAMLDIINHRRACHIITVEDPIEYYHPHKSSIVTPRELGNDVPTFSEALKRALAETRTRAGKLPLPVMVVGAGRGGKLGLEVVARTPGGFASVGSVGGAFDPGPGGAAAVAGLRGIPVFLGVSKGAPPELYGAMPKGRENLEKLGVKLTWGEWPGTGEGLPTNAAQAAKEILDALVPAGGARAPAVRK